jgi:hypothetical protein
MLGYSRFPTRRLYAVEISGWDGKEEFFVEHCELESDEDSGKQIALKRTLNDHAVLLVRLLQTDDSDLSHPSQPVAYGAERVGKTKSGLHQFRLIMMVPRPNDVEGSAT